MREERFVAVVTGPAGSGKSTVGFLLKKQIKRCANIDVDDIKHFIGFEYDLDADGVKQWRFEEWGLVGESIGLLALNFHKSGYSVLITGYLNEESLKEIQRAIKLTHKIILLPEIKTTKSRDSSRDSEIIMGSEAVKEHHDYFLSNEYFDDFTRVDSTNRTIEQTVEMVKDVINKNRGKL